MPRIDPKDLEHLEERSKSLIVEDPPGAFKGPWLPDKFDNRSEAWKENIAWLRNKTRAEAGQNEQGQTPEQEKAYKERLKEALRMKEKAKLAEQMVLNTK